MKADLEARDLASYKIEAHSVKSSMATIGLKDFSERAKRHEFAARDNDIAFIYGDSEAFINEYTSLCESLAGAVRYE
jgi:HPt (histidine-containing phosphotransfer) domain-containing protein